MQRPARRIIYFVLFVSFVDKYLFKPMPAK